MNRRHFFAASAAVVGAVALPTMTVPAGTGIRIDDRYPRDDVRHWGAVGDGHHDDGPAIRAALRHMCERGGGVVVLPTGVFRGL